jgi:hypothetical protein
MKLRKHKSLFSDVSTEVSALELGVLFDGLTHIFATGCTPDWISVFSHEQQAAVQQS